MTALRTLWAHRRDPQNGLAFFALVALWAALLPFIACLKG